MVHATVACELFGFNPGEQEIGTAWYPKAILLRLTHQLFYSFFKTLIGHTVTVELKNDLMIEGTLYAVDQFLNLKLRDIKVKDEDKYPHMVHN